MKKLIIYALAAGLIGCANQAPIRPVIDTKNVNISDMEADLKSCNTYAGVRDPMAAAMNGAVAGALVGAAFGAITGQMYGDPGYGAKVGAQYGALSGGVAQVVTSDAEQTNIVKRCMYGRGYTVLN